MTAESPGRLLTAADLSELPEDEYRRELHDGVIYVVPPPSDDHQWVGKSLYRALTVNEPEDAFVLWDVGVHISTTRMYVPDLAVVWAGSVFHDNAYEPAGVLLVVETVSPSSESMDLHTKPARYAEMGIPFFWRVEPGPRLVCLRLVGDKGYQEYASGRRGETVTVSEPWPVSIEINELVMPHKRGR